MDVQALPLKVSELQLQLIVHQAKALHSKNRLPLETSQQIHVYVIYAQQHLSLHYKALVLTVKEIQSSKAT